MINAHLSTGADATKVLAQFITDDGKKLFEEELDRSLVLRRVYFHNRNLIVNKLIHWLNQREFSLKRTRKAYLPKELKTQIENYRHGTLSNLVGYVVKKMAAFENCAPTNKSRLYNHYQKEIKPLFEFCKNW